MQINFSSQDKIPQPDYTKLMRLLLTSNGLTTKKITDKFLELIEKNPRDINFVFIPTAAWPEVDQSWVEINKGPIKNLGINIIELDLKNKKISEIEEVIEKADVVWVNGGNTFYLLYWVKKSGFTRVIKKFIDKNKLYVGLSAGSILASPTIEVADWKGLDDPKVVDLKDLNSLNLVDFHIFPHYKEEWEEVIKENESKLKGKLIRLKDNQAIVVEDEKHQII